MLELLFLFVWFFFFFFFFFFFILIFSLEQLPMPGKICDAIWENPPHGENLTFWVLVSFVKILISSFWN